MLVRLIYDAAPRLYAATIVSFVGVVVVVLFLSLLLIVCSRFSYRFELAHTLRLVLM